MHFTKEQIIRLLERIVHFTDKNLKEITNLNIDVNNEYDSFYVGMIIRQYSIINDIKILFSSKKNGYLTSELILFRCIVDDFIHIKFLVNQQNPEEEITKFNGDAINKNFNKLVDLAKLNEEKLGGNYPMYPTNKLIEELKEKLKQAPKRQQYFIDKENFKLKTFKSTGNLIRDLEDNNYSHSLRRAYYFWRKLSDHVHYSNFSYEELQIIDPTKDHTYTEFAEIIFYSYSVIIDSLSHFETKYNLKITDEDNLAEYYKDAGH